MMNGLQTLPQWREYFDNPEGALLGLMNSVYPLGKVISLLILSYMCDRWGRKLPLLIGFITCIAFAILQGLSKDIHSFIIARALLGFFTSFISQPSPIIITELAYPTQRGKLTALYNTFFVSHPSNASGFSPLCSCLVVLWLHLCCLVHIWNVQDPVNLELENPVSPAGSLARTSATGLVLSPRIAKVCIPPHTLTRGKLTHADGLFPRDARRKPAGSS